MTSIGLEELRAHVRWVAALMAGTTILMFLLVAVPWLLRIIEVDLELLAWTLTAYAATYAALMIAVGRSRSVVVLTRMLYALPLITLGFLSLLWQQAGGISHPSLAIVMMLPVVAGAALPRPNAAYVFAAFSIVTTTSIAAVTSADFAWYLTQLGVPGAALARVAGEDIAMRDPFPGATTTPAAAFLVVATFAAVQLGGAAAAVRSVRFVRRQRDANQWLHDGDSLATVAMRHLPASGAVVIASTAQVVVATKRFTQQMLLHNDPIVGAELTSMLTFDDRDAVRALLTSGGTIQLCSYRVGAEQRMAELSAQTFEHDGTRYASIVISDWADAAWLMATAGGLPEPLLVVGRDARLRYANAAARELFADLYPGRDVTPLLGTDWWMQHDARKAQITIADHAFEGNATQVRLPGGDTASFVMLTRAERA